MNEWGYKECGKGYLVEIFYLATLTGIGLRTLIKSAGDISHRRPLLPALMNIFGRLRIDSST